MAQLINVNTLQEEINEDIENYRNLANNKEVPVDVLTEIIETILVEREILLDEIENFNRYNFGKFNQEQSFRLILQNINPET
ncbi:MAG: hypothetical protein OEZ01_06890, partial [Candidatus Heimdallarchaeota archaeon]|nr:hypothetical protein [Candidatus Heimdallarchaeota archaeon]